MALYAGERDIAFMRGINRELINDIVQSEVDIYKLYVEQTPTNIYGESDSKTYYTPFRIASIIKPADQTEDYSEFGPNYSQTAVFAFLRDDLKKYEILIETGDIILWNELAFEVDHVIENNYFLSRNPETNKTIGSKFGWNVSIICNCHVSRKNRAQLEEVRFGSNEK